MDYRKLWYRMKMAAMNYMEEGSYVPWESVLLEMDKIEHDVFVEREMEEVSEHGGVAIPEFEGR